MQARVKKSLVAASVASGIGLAVVAGTGLASAATSTDNSANPQSSLIDKLASKFNLNKTEVQAVFDEERSAREAEHQQRMEERLNQAVTDGKLTSDQKDKVLAKMKETKAEIKAEMEAKRESGETPDKDSKTREERKAEMDAKRTELEQWAKDNNIPTEYLRMGMMGGPGGPHNLDRSGGHRGGPGGEQQ